MKGVLIDIPIGSSIDIAIDRTHLFGPLDLVNRQVHTCVGTEIFQRSRISAKPHAKQSENEIKTRKIRNRKESKINLIPNQRLSVTTRQEPGLRELSARFLVLKPKDCKT